MILGCRASRQLAAGQCGASSACTYTLHCQQTYLHACKHNKSLIYAPCACSNVNTAYLINGKPTSLTAVRAAVCRPYASGEVTVQPYNTLLSLATLSEVSSGILLLQNEVLHETCTRSLGVKNPSFKVMSLTLHQWHKLCQC